MESYGYVVITAGNIDKQSLHFVASFDKLGVESGEVQSLAGPITSADKLRQSDHTVIVWISQGGPVGFAKFGRKSLYLYSKQGKVREFPEAPCLLDFYVSTQLQRSGMGKSMFDNVLQLLSVQAEQLAYDRPSPKLEAFLAKHFNMKNGDLQPNRFMIFSGFSAEL